MLLNKCINNIPTESIKGSESIHISSICIDSRNIIKDSMFVAIKGTQTDGHNYIEQAIATGATSILCEELPNNIVDNITYIIVKNSEEVLGSLASNFYDNPSSKLKLVGVTGTNGKTTTATLLYQLFKDLGYKAGLLSTVCNYIDTKQVKSTHTTPDAVSINHLLHEMVEIGCDYCFMEVSSHAIAQHRISGLNFAGGIFTNLTRDHLDYHKTVDNYIKAKKSFFDNLPPTAFSLVNCDDKNGLVMVQNTKSQINTYSLKSASDFKAKIIEMSLEGMILNINNIEVTLPFTGRFNAYNLLAVYACATLLNQEKNDILVTLSLLKSVSGRFETIQSSKGFTVVVDYAHTPDALENVLTTIHDILNNQGQIITVCGAGGNRDKGKRPLMAIEAVKNSNKVIFTSDNPRFEDPNEIIKDMLEGVPPTDKNKTLAITDRREAIKVACMLAQPKDVILIAGKGHEDYQSVKGVNHHFDDKEEVRKIINTLQN